MTKQLTHTHAHTRTHTHTHTHTDVKNELTVTKEEECGEGIVREFGMDTYTRLYLKWVTNKVLICSTGQSAQCDTAA